MTRDDVLALRAMALAVVAQQEAHLVVVRASSAALVAQCDAALALVEAAPVGTDECPHPSDRVISTAVACFPNRAKCTACGETVERVPA